MDAIFDQRCTEVDEQPQALVSQLQVGQQLAFMNQGRLLNCLKFNYHQILNHDISSVAYIKPDLIIYKRDRLLTHNAQATLPQLIGQHRLIG